jgi:hypothetical protein
MFKVINKNHVAIQEKCDLLIESKEKQVNLEQEIKELVQKHNYKFDNLQDYYNFENAMMGSNVHAIEFFIEIGNNPFEKASPFHERLFIVHNTLELESRKFCA